MRVIITGGTGLIGRALTNSLANDGHELIILSRQPDRYKGQITNANLVAWDGKTAVSWQHLADGADAIVNLAGASIASGRWTPTRKQLIRQSRVQAGQAITQAITAATQKPRVVIQASAVGYYGPCGHETITEDSPVGHDFLANVCQEWEESTAVLETMGVRRAIIRTGIVLSLAGGALPRLVLPYRLFIGGPLGNGRQYMPWIHIADEIRAIRFLIEQENASGPFNLTAPVPLTNREFGQVLGKVMKRPSLLPVPAFALRLL
ncbi:MAG: TIGR01777 family protein, partial [Chloroflexi bacterium]